MRSANVTKLHHFPQLKCLNIDKCGYGETEGENLVESINSWGPQPELTYLYLHDVFIPESLMPALCKCTNLLTLKLWCCGVRNKLSVLLASPPPLLAEFRLESCRLNGKDVDDITKAIKGGTLNNLVVLDINENGVGKEAVDRLLEAIVSTRHQKHFKLNLTDTDIDENSNINELDEQFIDKWEGKLTDTDIDVTWYSLLDEADL